MSVEALKKAIYAHATADAGVSALVGTGVFPEGDVPANAPLPYVASKLVSNVPVEHLGGSSTLSRARWQFTARAETSLLAAQIGDALRAAFNRTAGTLGAGASTVTVDDVLVQLEMEEPLDPEDASGRGPFGYIIDFAFWYRN